MAFLENYPEQNKENVSETSSEYYFGQSFAILTKTHQCVERESKGGVEGQRGLAKGEVVCLVPHAHPSANSLITSFSHGVEDMKCKCI